jgi:Lon protease-like protein
MLRRNRRTVPMFPLGSVLFPGAMLPLHIFEPRYRALTEACLTGDGQFGVVLIERGSEVGGGDTRFQVGTVARIVEAARLPDGRYVLAAVGTERFRVQRWLPEDPYPRAEIEMIAEPASSDAPTRRDDVQRLLQRVLGMRAELGEQVPVVDTLDADLVLASFQAAALAPLTSLDAQRMLEVDGAEERFDRLAGALEEEARFLELRLAGS